jgi:hypothetical protein
MEDCSFPFVKFWDGVVNPDPHYFWKLDPDRIRPKSWIRIRIESKLKSFRGLKELLRAVDAHNGGLEDQYGTLLVVADSHHFAEELGPDPH